MFSFKHSLSISLLAVISFILIGSEVDGTPNPAPSNPVQIDGKGRCYSLAQKDWKLISHPISDKLVQDARGEYRLRNKDGDPLWIIQPNPLQIISYPGQAGPANLVAIQLTNGAPFMFTIGEHQSCVGAVDPTYAERIKTEKVEAVFLYQLSKFP